LRPSTESHPTAAPMASSAGIDHRVALERPTMFPRAPARRRRALRMASR
jgi:hypothetical protein